MSTNPLNKTTFKPAVCLIGCLLLLPGSGLAQQGIDIPTTINDGFTGEFSDELGMTMEDGKLQLSLDDTIALALQRNLTLVVQRYQRSQALRGIEQAVGNLYDIDLQVDGSISESTSPTTSFLQDTGGAALTRESQSFNTVLNRATPIGGGAQIRLDNSRSATSNLANSPNPGFVSTLVLGYQQPLLRNFGRETTERNLIVARNDAAISRENFQTQVETIIQQASDTYWNLVESLEQMKVAEESLALAENLHEMNRIQVEVGTKAPLEMVQSEAGVASRRQDIISLKAQIGDRSDELRRLGNLNRGDLWDIALEPVTSPEVAHQPIDVREAVQTALTSRPDYRIQRLRNKTLGLDSRVARNRKKPQLDVTASYQLQAVEGTFRDRFGDFVGESDFFDGLSTIGSRDFDGWTVSFTFGYPLGNRSARAQKAIADLAEAQGDFQLQELEIQILTDVRSAARAVETAAEQIETAKTSSRLAQKNLEAEQKRYENGLSTSFTVLEIQEDLSEARRLEVSAVINYRRAETAYYRAIGQLLERFKVRLGDEEEP